MASKKVVTTKLGGADFDPLSGAFGGGGGEDSAPLPVAQSAAQVQAAKLLAARAVQAAAPKPVVTDTSKATKNLFDDEDEERFTITAPVIQVARPLPPSASATEPTTPAVVASPIKVSATLASVVVQSGSEAASIGGDDDDDNLFGSDAPTTSESIFAVPASSAKSNASVAAAAATVTNAALLREDKAADAKADERSMTGLFVPTGAVETKTIKKEVVMDAALFDGPSDEEFVQALAASKASKASAETASKKIAELSVEEELARMLANPMLSLGDDADGAAVDDAFDFNSYIQKEAAGASSSNKLFDD